MVGLVGAQFCCDLASYIQEVWFYQSTKIDDFLT